jgi:hypothetical protein
MRFVCETASNGGLYITQVQNPVTHTEVHVVPPYLWETWEQLDVFLANFEVYCRVNYHFGHSDPAGVDPSGWPSEALDVALFRASSGDSGAVVV